MFQQINRFSRAYNIRTQERLIIVPFSAVPEIIGVELFVIGFVVVIIGGAGTELSFPLLSISVILPDSSFVEM